MQNKSLSRWIKRGLLALFLLASGSAVWGFIVEPQQLVVRAHPLALPGWPADYPELDVAVLADIHTGSPHHGLEVLADIVAATNRSAPDLVLLAGDFVIQGVLGGEFVPPEQSAEILGRLQAPLGVYAVLGNHDWWLSGPRVADALEAVGITLLEDRSVTIEVDGRPFNLAGVSDLWESDHDVAKALAQLDRAHPTVVFTHNPDIFPTIPDWVDLTVAGHTHGGQVKLPLIGRPIIPSSYGDRFAIGHIEEADRHLFISPGLGTSILPVRFGVPPEVSFMQISAAGGAPAGN